MTGRGPGRLGRALDATRWWHTFAALLGAWLMMFGGILFCMRSGAVFEVLVSVFVVAGFIAFPVAALWLLAAVVHRLWRRRFLAGLGFFAAWLVCVLLWLFGAAFTAAGISRATEGMGSSAEAG